MSAKFTFASIALAVTFSCFNANWCQGTEIWTGAPITFEKPAFADWTDAANQDRITDNVWITRSNVAGIYNAAQEAGYVNFVSPADTLWAFGTTADFDTLNFDTWQNIVDPNIFPGGPPASVGLDMVLWLQTDDVAMDIEFLSWGVGPGSGAGFSYRRSTMIPEPSTCAIIAVLSLGGLALRKFI